MVWPSRSATARQRSWHDRRLAPGRPHRFAWLASIVCTDGVFAMTCKACWLDEAAIWAPATVPWRAKVDSSCHCEATIPVQITRASRVKRGRRIEMADPGRSLLLAKPTAALPHKGGLRLEPSSRDYRVISQWIAGGAEGPGADDPRLETISVLPKAALLKPGDRSRVLVNVHYSDGRIVDVTHWSQFKATDEAVASVTDHGVVSVRGSGEGAVLVWFGSKVALARMTVPYPNEVSKSAYAQAPRRNFIDDLNLSQLETLRLRPSPRCDDDVFLRRATLDTIGRLPTPEERDRYLDQPSATRRDALIEHLLSTEDFVNYWTYRWCDILLINGTRLRPVAVKTYYQWVQDSVARTNLGTSWSVIS